MLVLLLGWRLMPDRPWAGIVGATLFALHPVHAESVAWISGRTDLLAALGVLGALVLLLDRLPPQAGPGACREARLGWRAWATVALAAVAVFAKEMAIALPLALLAFAALRPGPCRRRFAVAGVLTAAAAVPYAVMRVAVADIVSALTTDRPYRASVKPADALEIIRHQKGIKLMADAVDAVTDFIENADGRNKPSVFHSHEVTLPHFLRL